MTPRMEFYLTVWIIGVGSVIVAALLFIGIAETRQCEHDLAILRDSLAKGEGVSQNLLDYLEEEGCLEVARRRG